MTLVTEAGESGQVIAVWGTLGWIFVVMLGLCGVWIL